MMMYNKNYCKTLTGKEWKDCSQALVLQMGECQDKIKKHQEAIESLNQQIKFYDTAHYKIKGHYLYIKPDCYTEEKKEVGFIEAMSLMIEGKVFLIDKKRKLRFNNGILETTGATKEWVTSVFSNEELANLKLEPDCYKGE